VASDGQDRAALLDVFLNEAWETLWTLTAGARQLAGRSAVADPPIDLPIVAHRLRGSAALYGFPGLADLAGLIEDALTRLRGAAPDEHHRAAVALAGFVEFLRTTLKRIEAGDAEDPGAIAAFRARYAAVLAPPVAEGAPDVEEIVGQLDRFFSANGDILTYFGSEAAEHLDSITRAMLALDQAEPDADALPMLLRTVHTLKGAAYTVGCHPVGEMAHRLEDLLVGIRDGQIALAPTVMETIAATVAVLRSMVATDAVTRDRLPEMLERALPLLRVAPPISPPAKRAPAIPTPSGSRRDEAPRTIRPSVRVSVACLDALVDLVGEFVAARSRLERHVEQLGRVDDLLCASAARMTRVVQNFELKHEYSPVSGPGPAGFAGGSDPADGDSIAKLFEELEFDRYSDFNVLARSVREISADMCEIRAQLAGVLHDVQEDTAGSQRLVGSLRNEVTRARMVPIGRLFARFPRQVRDASRAAGKAVTLKVSGTAVEVDSAIIEQLADPLLHLVLNAIAHGLETEEERLAAGKPPEGSVHLRAHHENGAVCIEVEDDGRGIQLETLKERAVEEGLIKPEAAPLLPEHEILNLIFLPGFTTAPQLTTASGRGIGLDVVRTNVARLNGDVDVTTQPGAGTRFSIRIPLTVLISDAVLVEAGGQIFAIPLSAIRLIVTVSSDRIQSGEKETVWIRDQLVDLIRLDRYLALPESQPDRIPLLVLRAGGRSLALAVDALHGKEQLVIKGLGGFPEGIGPFSSGTISGDGRVILVLNPARLSPARGGPSPVSDGRARAEPERPPSTASPVLPDVTRRFLLVDDSVSVRKFVGQMLERAGFGVVTASSGAEALQHLEKTAVHAVITDLEMPNVNGYELIEHLRRRPSTRDLPIVILTTRGGQKHQELARRLGVEHYLTKPIEEDAFVELMASLVPGAKATAAVEGDGVS
jgi:chemosensory pili system protein ChpA (sensor histidine kinase/response regulator)